MSKENLVLLHYSAQPTFVLRIEATPQTKDSSKPCGLWVSIGNDWEEWCVGEDFGIARLKYIYQIILSPKTNILTLSVPYDLDRFTKDFQREGVTSERLFLDMRIIDWAKVAQQYNGIIIAPYLWERRLALMWYYGWDCASGCIWNSAVIESVKPLPSADDPSSPDTPPQGTSTDH